MVDVINLDLAENFYSKLISLDRNFKCGYSFFFSDSFGILFELNFNLGLSKKVFLPFFCAASKL